MSFTVNVPPSMAVRMEKLEKSSSEPEKRSREDWKKLKELEEARKAGTAPAMQDEEGKDINPHIPQYIMQAPWYFSAMTPTLKHQRQQDEKIPEFNKMGEWYKKGVKSGPVATKFRKGACENCGSMTHKKKDCLERPRRVGAKFTGSDIAPDEHLQSDLSFAYDVKRDRWNGYDTEEHEGIIKKYQMLEEAKRQLKEATIENEVMGGDKPGKDKESKPADSDGEEDEDKYADDVDMPGQKFETKQRITVRNLRIREDTAKYLYNLDPNSAFYDPKTRSMRENPYKNSGMLEKELQYSGDNFVRFSGDAHSMAKQQLFAWEAYEKGADVHLQADPTKLELLTQEYHKKKTNFESDQKDSLVKKYGGEDYLHSMPKELLLSQTENYIEYSRHGTVIKGQEKAKIMSIYEEDVYINNHTSVWGSFWHEGQWGYKCCHSFVKESYCTGEAGKLAAQSNIQMLKEAGEEDEEAEEPKSLLQQHQEKIEVESSKKKKKKKNKKHKKHKKHKKQSSSDSESDQEEKERQAKEQRLKDALLRQEREVWKADRLMAMDERKRPYNSMFTVQEPTEEEMEAYRLKKRRDEDPMSHF